jgi:hypothetical protein
MKTLREFIIEAEERSHRPVRGDGFAFELDDGTLLETYVMDEDSQGNILLDATPKIVAILENWNLLDEHGGGIGPRQHWQSLMHEQPIEEIQYMGMVESLDPEQKDLIRYLVDKMGYSAREAVQAVKSGEVTADIMEPEEDDYYYDGPEDDYSSDDPGPMHYSGLADLQGRHLDEAEYQGHKVSLGKPMRGDVKKFKVYVRDPKTGNVKKVNFGHGGTSAKRLGQKTMRIKKSNPARRRSFRARHHCENPGPRTGARYWSCRAW